MLLHAMAGVSLHESLSCMWSPGKFFPKEPPARACFAVKTLPLGAKVEIECIAAL